MLFLQDFDNVSVEYVTLPGWKASIADCRSFAALPERARAYVEEVERLLGVPGKLRCGIDLLIYGPAFLEVNLCCIVFDNTASNVFHGLTTQIESSPLSSHY